MSRCIQFCSRVTVGLLAAIFVNGSAFASQTKQIYGRKPLTAAAQRCLADILKTGDWRYTPQLHKKMMSAAVFAQADLDGPTRKHYIYVMDEFSFCGTAGCSMMIAEADQDGHCREIYDDSGSDVVTILYKRDHGYHRLLTPCELRFDGREYQKIHDECPNVDVQR